MQCPTCQSDSILLQQEEVDRVSYSVLTHSDGTFTCYGEEVERECLDSDRDAAVFVCECCGETDEDPNHFHEESELSQ